MRERKASEAHAYGGANTLSLEHPEPRTPSGANTLGCEQIEHREETANGRPDADLRLKLQPHLLRA
jgi:hypothetical protein